MMTLTFYAHGTTVDNQNHISSGWHDAPLSPQGIEESKRLGQLTATASFACVYTSDLQRAVATAELAFAGRFPLVADGRLRECNYGRYNAMPSAVVEPLQEDKIKEPFPEGESYEDVAVRVADFLNDIHLQYPDQHIAIVGHKATQLALNVVILKQTWEEAFRDDWRKQGKWQPGWDYVLK